MNAFKILGLLLLSWLLLILSLYLYLYKPNPGDSNEVALFYFIGILAAYVYSFAIYMVVGLYHLDPLKRKRIQWIIILIAISIFFCTFSSLDIVELILPARNIRICPDDGKNVPLFSFGPCEFYFNVLLELLLNTSLMILAVKIISRLRKHP